MTPVEVTHWGYANKSEARRKGLRNLTLLHEMIDLKPHDPYLCYQIGRTLLNLRRFEKALLWLHRATDAPEAPILNPGVFLHAHILKAQTLNRLNRAEEAEKVLEDLITKRPEYGPAYYTLGRLYYAKEEFEAAVDKFQTYLNLGSADPIAGFSPSHQRFTAAFLLGRCKEALGLDDAAAQAYRISASSEPDNPEPSLALARLALAKGQTSEARTHIQKCFQLCPGSRGAAQLQETMANYG